MKEAIIMTKEEYAQIELRLGERAQIIRDLQKLLKHAEFELRMETERANNLWDKLNRPAIEAAAKAAEDEYRAWCEEVADKYDELDWIERMSNKYNNEHISDACKRHNCKPEDLQWKIWSEKYKSKDDLERHGWPEKKTWRQCNWDYFHSIAYEYEDARYYTHERSLYSLMQYYAVYDNAEYENFWKLSCKDHGIHL